MGAVPRIEQAERDAMNYDRNATQYYLAGRVLTFAGCFPVTAMLLHHAVELYLKADLRLAFSRAQLKNDYRHDLRKVWRAFKDRHVDRDLGAHDRTIDDLHKFERIRYPDPVTDEGMVGYVAVVRPVDVATIVLPDGQVPPPDYVLGLNEVDNLVSEIVTTRSINPEFYFGDIRGEWREILHRANSGFPAPAQ